MVTELHTHGFHVAKLGNTPSEYEDAFTVDIEAGRFAIADGATESCFARQWAQLLTTGFLANPHCLAGTGRRKTRKIRISEWLAPLQSAWQKGIDWETLPWYAREKTRRGACATFLGLVLDNKPASSSGSARWQAIAIGDCVLFHIQDNQLKTAFPLTRSSDFGISPLLICSNEARNQAVVNEARVRKGEWYPSDLFVLCTDALAQWFLAQWEAGTKPWSVLSSLSSQEEFEKLVIQLCNEHSVRNDDMTAIVISTR